MNKDQKKLELLYEQVTEGENRVLKLEVEYAKIIAEHAIKDLTESMERRIRNRGNIKGARLGDFIKPEIEHAKQLFKNEPESISLVYDNFVRYDVFSSLIYFTARRAHDLEPKDIKMVIIYPEMLVQYKGEENKHVIPFLDKQALEEKLRKTIEEAFVVRYNDCLEPLKKNPTRMKQWAEWRKQKLKYENLTTNLPELDGIF